MGTRGLASLVACRLGGQAAIPLSPRRILVSLRGLDVRGWRWCLRRMLGPRPITARGGALLFCFFFFGQLGFRDPPLSTEGSLSETGLRAAGGPLQPPLGSNAPTGGSRAGAAGGPRTGRTPLWAPKGSGQPLFDAVGPRVRDFISGISFEPFGEGKGVKREKGGGELWIWHLAQGEDENRCGGVRNTKQPVMRKHQLGGHFLLYSPLPPHIR